MKNQLQSLRTALQQTLLAGRIRQLFEPSDPRKRAGGARREKRDFGLEPMEPRLLLSADINYTDANITGADYTLVAPSVTTVQLKLTGGALVGAPVTLDDGVVKLSRGMFGLDAASGAAAPTRAPPVSFSCTVVALGATRV